MNDFEIRGNFLRPVKDLVIVSLSESFTIRPRLPFRVNLRFAETDRAVDLRSF